MLESTLSWVENNQIDIKPASSLYYLYEFISPLDTIVVPQLGVHSIIIKSTNSTQVGIVDTGSGMSQNSGLFYPPYSAPLVGHITSMDSAGKYTYCSFLVAS